MEYRSVLCVTGDSLPLEKTELEAARIARLCGCRLILLHVIEKWRNSDMVVTDSPEWQSVLDNWVAEAMEFLGKKEELFRAQGVNSIKKEVRSGEKAAETLAVAAEQYVSLIVLPNYHGWIKSFMASSFSAEISIHSPCSVLWVND